MSEAVVMVVEDNPVSARVIERIVAGEGYAVIVVGRLDEARHELARRSDIRLIVCDVDLPDGSGIELVAELHGAADPATPPVVMCTSADDIQSVHAAVAAGCAAYVLKPVQPAILVDRISALLRGPEADADRPAATDPETDSTRPIPTAG